MRFLGIDLGGTNIAAGVASPDGGLLSKISIPSMAWLSPDDVVARMAQAARAAIEAAGLSPDDISGAGVGIPGICDAKNGIVYTAPNLGWKMFPAAEKLSALLGLPVSLGNDADCAALGECTAGAGKKYQNIIMLTLGTGVGGGIVIGRKLFSGTGFGGELGHIVLKIGGEPCTCGRRGCFERYASATALIAQTREAALQNPESKIWELCGGDPGEIDGRTSFEAASLGDPAAIGVVEVYIGYLAEGIADLINAFRPEAVVLGGGVSRQGENLTAPLNEKVRGLVYAHDLIEPPPVLAAALGNDAGIIGAAMLCKG